MYLTMSKKVNSGLLAQANARGRRIYFRRRLCPEAQAKATVLTNTGCVRVLMVMGKSDHFMARSMAAFVDKVRADKTKLRCDSETASLRHPHSTILEPINRGEHQSVGGVERAHQSTILGKC